MSRRIDVELTSDRGDGTWTWRAAGAREPRGTVDAVLLPPGSKVGDVLRVDTEISLDGIDVTAVLPPKGGRPEPERLEIIGPPDRPPPPPDEVARPARPGRKREGRAREGRPPGGPRPAEERRRPQREREQRPTGERPRRPATPPAPTRPKPKKLRPGRVHREELLAGLPPEQQPIAEQLVRGGMPAVRTALHEQNTRARAEGKPEAPVQAVLTIAEKLVALVRRAEWLDRAEAAAADAEEVALRDLRSVVVSADDVARDDETRALASRLREVLDRRSAAEAEEWVTAVRQSLDSGRVVRALRISSQAPEPGTRLPEDLAARLTEAAGAALAADVAPDRWATVLDAVAWSPVRPAVTPSGTPPEPTEALLAAVRKHAGRVPTVAERFGVEPPAPRGTGGARRTAKTAGSKRPARRRSPRTGPSGEAGTAPAAASTDAAEPTGTEEPAQARPAQTEADAAGAPPAPVATEEPTEAAPPPGEFPEPADDPDGGRSEAAAPAEAPPAGDLPRSGPAGEPVTAASPEDAQMPPGIRRISPPVAESEPTAASSAPAAPHGDPLSDAEGGSPDPTGEDGPDGDPA